ncbi:polymeric immunoglobulin receptor-like [Mantella aurantiaca]
MITLRTILYKTVWNPLVLLIIFHTWTQCSSSSHVREVQTTVKGFITITCNYNTYQYKNKGSSWCRQISEIECDNIVHTRGFNPSIYKERVNVSQTMDQFGTVNVTIFNLQPWDTGLYNWRIWNGNDYEIIQTVLLQVINGLPPNMRVARYKLHEMAEIHCESTLYTKNSKIWYKKIRETRSQWVAHSSGDTATDYKSRVMVINDKQKNRMTVKFQQLEAWDGGIYQCIEPISKTILTEILLIVTMDNERKPLNPTDDITKSSDLNTYHPAIFHQSSTLNNSYATQQPQSNPIHNKPWNIIRWILFLSMALCVVFCSFYKRSSEEISGVRQIYNQLLRSQIQNTSKA